MALDPQAKLVLEAAAKLPPPDYATLDPKEARRVYIAGRALQQPPKPEVAASADHLIPGPHGPIPARLVRPLGSRPEEALPVLVYFHGGGWVIGNIDTHDTLARILANKSGAAVLNVDYRLAPEHKFPSAVDDCIAATRWAATEGRKFGLDPSRIAVGGDSAGGNLAAAVALHARDAGGPSLSFQLLVYPATDMAADSPSHSLFAEGYLLTRDGIRWYTGQYLRGPADIADWRASPIRAPDLSRLPPALVLTAGFDPLRDEGKAYADRLAAAGVSVRYHDYEGMLHGFFNMGGVLDQAHGAHDEAAAALRHAFA
jgi:acetyl esterase